ncbi:MAG: hypothetical protein LBJ12_00040 [Oscillospiraceae bacterium]|nr:hypothetical protein [Oscillospiraceae bacterium]
MLPSIKQRVNDGHNHISPDRIINASTAALPEQTWFIKNAFHQMETSYSGLYEYFLRADNPNVFDNAKYPQYLKMDELYKFSPLEKEQFTVDSVFSGLFEKLLSVWRNLLKLFSD